MDQQQPPQQPQQHHQLPPTPTEAPPAPTNPSLAFKPPLMSNKQASSLRKQALAGAAADRPQHHLFAQQHHHLGAVAEEAVAGGGGGAGAGGGSSSLLGMLSLDAAAGAADGCGGPASSSGRRSVQLSSWDRYWDARQAVEVPGRGVFTAYSAGSGPALVLCLHGGGYTGLTWSLVAQQLKQQYRVLALDLRGHGSTTTTDDADLSAETMTQDIVAVWSQLFGSGSERVPTLLVGHSMGGALAVWAAASRQIRGLEGVVVIDVVEGTALAALPHMAAVLAGRPPGFASVEAACEWAVRSGICKNREMAGVSLPSQLVQQPTTAAAAAGGAAQHQQHHQQPWVWRTDLAASAPFWRGWYEGLSEAFLALPVPKVLLLAGTDRLDKPLTIGQMQGRFQLLLMPTAGHAIQEDEPARTAEHLQQFLHRFRIGEPPLVIPRARPGVRPVLPVVAGPLLHE